jgi:hypothetical protein
MYISSQHNTTYQSEERHRQLLDAVKATGECFIINTKLSGKIVIRMACGGIEQTKADVLRAYNVISGELRKLK